MKKKITQFRWLAALIMLVAAMVMPSTAWAQITPTKPTSGEGTADSPYQISNAAELYWFAGLVNGDASVCTGDVSQNTSANAVLTADITVNTGVLDENGNLANNTSGFRSWTPIGIVFNKYAGTFDGKGHTISGLYFNNTNNSIIGLFGWVDSGSKICNVGIVDSYFNGFSYIGGVCGYCVSGGEITNCYNTGTVIGTSFNIGGVCGCSSGTITDCYNTGNVSGTSTSDQEGRVGGVCGCNNGYPDMGTITRSYNSGKVSGGYYVGGVCGANGFSDPAQTINCYNTGEVTGTNDFVGGICGLGDGNSSNVSVIENCYNIGTVSGTTAVGGVIGGIYESGVVNVTNCYYLEGCNAEGKTFNCTEGTSKTEEQFKNGEVAYQLAQGCTVGETFYDGSVWGQQLGENDYPVFGSAYKVLMAARDGLEGSIYWATFSNLNSNAELIDPMGGIAVYNATVSDGTLTLAKRMDNKVSSGEGVLLKANSEYVNAKNISDYVADTTGENDLVATPAEARVINDTNYKHYRLTYNDVGSKEGIGFYLGVVKDETGNVTSNDGSQIRVTPGKAYLKVSTQAATEPSTAKLARGFAFPGDGETTGIECITVTDESLHSNGNAKGIFDLQGRKVSKPTKGVYINNGKKVIIK